MADKAHTNAVVRLDLAGANQGATQWALETPGGPLVFAPGRARGKRHAKVAVVLTFTVFATKADPVIQYVAERTTDLLLEYGSGGKAAGTSLEIGRLPCPLLTGIQFVAVLIHPEPKVIRTRPCTLDTRDILPLVKSTRDRVVLQIARVQRVHALVVRDTGDATFVLVGGDEWRSRVAVQQLAAVSNDDFAIAVTTDIDAGQLHRAIHVAVDIDVAITAGHDNLALIRGADDIAIQLDPPTTRGIDVLDDDALVYRVINRHHGIAGNTDGLQVLTRHDMITSLVAIHLRQPAIHAWRLEQV